VSLYKEYDNYGTSKIKGKKILGEEYVVAMRGRERKHDIEEISI